MSDEEWVALLSEIQALARAGVPLDSGLAALSADFGGNVGRSARRIVEQLQAGRALPEILTTLGYRSAPAYAAIVESGIRSGQLPQALQASVETSAASVELRRRLVVAMIYPAMVGFFVCFLLIQFGEFLAPKTLDFVHALNVKTSWLVSVVHLLQWATPVFAFLLLVIVLVVGGLLFGFMPDWALRVLPGFRHWPELVRLTNFTSLLSLLVEHRQPLPRSLRLAAQAAGGTKLMASAESLAAACETGADAAPAALAGLPATIPLLLSGPLGGQRVANGLRRLTESYRRQIDDKLNAARTQLPAACIVGFAGSALLVYALFEFVPLAELLWGLGRGV